MPEGEEDFQHLAQVFRRIAEGDPNPDDGTDTDGDGLTDHLERNGFRGGNGLFVTTDPNDEDTDGDGATDGEEAGELAVGLSGDYYPMPTNPASADTDGDTLGDFDEVDMGLSATMADTDVDGLDDATELPEDFDPFSANSDGGHRDDAVEFEKESYPFHYDLTALEHAATIPLGFVTGDYGENLSEWGIIPHDYHLTFGYLSGWLASGYFVIGDVRDTVAALLRCDALDSTRYRDQRQLSQVWRVEHRLNSPPYGGHMIEIREKKLRKELVDARQRLERNSQRRGKESRTDLEQVARYLYWLEDPEAHENLQRVIESYDPQTPYAGKLMELGNFHRMLGDQEQSRRYFERAYDILKRTLNENEEIGLQYPIQAAFLVGDYQEAERLAERHRELDPDPRLLVRYVGKLARARRLGDPHLADEAVAGLAEAIRRDRTKVSSTGGINLWDWYEIAQQTKVELESEAARAPKEPESRSSSGAGYQEPEAINVSGPDLSGRDLRGDDSFRGANLAGANLSRANLHLQSLDEADLSGANLHGADLSRGPDPGCFSRRRPERS